MTISIGIFGPIYMLGQATRGISRLCFFCSSEPKSTYSLDAYTTLGNILIVFFIVMIGLTVFFYVKMRKTSRLEGEDYEEE